MIEISVPEDVLSNDGQVETSYDSYNQAAVIDLTNFEQPVEEIDNNIIDLRTDDALSGKRFNKINSWFKIVLWCI